MNYLEIPLRSKPLESAVKELLELIYYLDEHITEGRISNATLTLGFRENAKIDVAALSRSVNDLVTSLNRTFAKDFSETLYESSHAPTFSEDPWPWLVESKRVKPIEPGNCYLSGGVFEMMECADSVFRSYATSIGAVNESYTSIIPYESFVQNGYLTSFPQHAFFVASAHQSLAALENIARVTPTSGNPGREYLSTPSHLLAPTVCYHCFESLKNGSVTNRAIFSARALCHRNEANNARSLLRLRVFNMREIIFFGDAAYVEDTRHDALRFCKSFLEALRLRFRVATASDPFFVTEASQRRVFQKLSRSKLEVQVYIPFNDRWSSVASFNNHSATLTAKYKIGPQGLCSGCFGIGYERLIFAVISQLGFDIEAIANALREFCRQQSIPSQKA